MSLDRAPRPLALALALAAPTAFADVLVVDQAAGPGSDFVEIQGAIDAAAEGDLILVRAGGYASFSVAAKGVSIVAEKDQLVFVGGTMRVQDTAPGQAVHLRSLRTGQAAGEGLWVEDCAGTVWVESCTLVGEDLSSLFDSTHGARILDSEAVVLVRTDARGGDASTSGGGGGDGLRLQDSRVHVWGGSYVGGEGAFHDDLGGWGGDGIDQRGGFLFAASALLAGGMGGGADDDPSDPFGGGTGVSCGLPGQGGAGLSLDDFLSASAPVAAVYGLQLDPGPGGWTTSVKGCSDGADGLPIQNLGGALTTTATPERVLRASSPVRELQELKFTLTGPANDSAFVFASSTPSALFLGAQLGSLFLGAPTPLVGAGVLPAGGELELAWSAPLLAPGAEGVQLYAQSVWIDAGGQLVLGPVSGLTLLDQLQ